MRVGEGRPGGAGRAYRTLVVVHVPKTAGTSLRASLEQAFGDGLRADYADTPLQHSPAARRWHAASQALQRAGRPLGVPCVHGHFLACKYALATGTRYATWLRDPVQRVVSRYHHYQRAMQAGETAHARWGLVPGLDFEAFARLPQFRDTCAEYFWMFPLKRFEFIGIVERYETDFPRFCARFGIDPGEGPGRENTNPEKAGLRYEVEDADQRLIRRLNPRDVALYEKVLARG